MLGLRRKLEIHRWPILRAPYVRSQQTILLLSVHKGASTFLAHRFAPLVARLFRGMRHLEIGRCALEGKDYQEMQLSPRDMVVSRIYPRHFGKLIETPVPASGRFGDKRLIMLRRDPRDAAISWYYSVAFSHDPNSVENPDGFQRQRLRFRRLGPTESIRKATAQRAIKEFRETDMFLETYPHTCLTTYETLVSDFSAWMSQVKDYLGWPDEIASRIRTQLEHCVVPPRQEDVMKHKRRVTPGNWKEVFDEPLRAMFEREIGEGMERAGYGW